MPDLTALDHDLKKFNKSYKKLRKFAIKDNVYTEKEGRALIQMMDALDACLDDLYKILSTMDTNQK